MLIDTNALLRSIQPKHPQYEVVKRAFHVLLRRGEKPSIVPQNLIEFWVVATRPIAQNGLGFSTAEALNEISRVKTLFALLPEVPAIYSVWESLVSRHKVYGKPAHDARIVAAMQVHGIGSIFTFDRSGFSRFPGVEVISPMDVAI